MIVHHISTNLECRTKEMVDDLKLFDGEREEIDLLQGLDLSVLHQPSVVTGVYIYLNVLCI